ncbi:hypothetical protein FH972_025896 [Carpinus fangiana]|uniref:Uncharacterized protein n=1 Tax=Carpinus fangiana TaxID=176857 RepID=A0A5N6L2Q5_9ROSI|nr:hypothetical protein FH972_025896 [Carpinus fangiana]
MPASIPVPTKARAQPLSFQQSAAFLRSTIASKPPAVNPQELMWAYQLKREHGHLLTRIDDLSATVATVEHQQAACASDFCTIKNLEQTRELDAEVNRENAIKLTRRVEALDSSITSTVQKSGMALIQPLQSRTTSLETQLKALSIQISEAKTTLGQSDHRTVTAIELFAKQLKNVTDRLLAKGMLEPADLSIDSVPYRLRGPRDMPTKLHRSSTASFHGQFAGGLNAGRTANDDDDERETNQITVSTPTPNQPDHLESIVDVAPVRRTSKDKIQIVNMARRPRTLSEATTVDECAPPSAKKIQAQKETLVSDSSFLKPLLVRPRKPGMALKNSRTTRKDSLRRAHAKDGNLGHKISSNLTLPRPQAPRKPSPWKDGVALRFPSSTHASPTPISRAQPPHITCASDRNQTGKPKPKDHEAGPTD